MQLIPCVQEGASPSICISMLDVSQMPESRASPLSSSDRSGVGTLYTATLHLAFEDYSISMFHACRAVSRSEVMDRVGVRIGSHLLAQVEIREGIDLDHPVVARLVPSEIARRLADYGDCNRSCGPLQLGGDLHIQERSGA
jgi:hypothetical protein